MNDIVTRRAVDGAAKIALRFPAGAVRGTGAALNAALGEEGRLVTGAAGVSAWRFETVEQEGDEAYLIGPDTRPAAAADAGGIASLDAVAEGDAARGGTAGLEAGLTRLGTLARALGRLLETGELPRGIVSTGVLFPDEDAVLVLPPAAVARALAASGAPARAAALARLSSPRAKGPEADASFLLAQSAYRIAAAEPPYEREAGETSGIAGAALPLLPIGLACPGLDPALAALIDRALADPTNVSLGEWAAALGGAGERGWRRELSAEEEEALQKRRRALEAGEKGRSGRAEFFRKRGGILIGAAVLLVVAGLILGDVARAQRDKPDYSWLTARELVQRYYLAIDSLDLDSLEACGETKAIRADRDFLVNLVVLTKTRTAYEGKSPVLRAAVWLAAGKPAPAPTDFLYGIVGLSLTGGDAEAGATSTVVSARYSLWLLDRVDDPSGEPSKAHSVPVERRRVDELRLERGKKGWRIASLDRTELD